MFSTDISTPVLIILGVCLLCAVLGAVVGLRPMRVVARRGRRLARLVQPEQTDGKPVPPVSVIIYTKHSQGDISGFIEELSRQEGVEFEMIVVADHSDDKLHDNTRDAIEGLQAMTEKYPNLKVTFVPRSARDISVRKLAITEGIKLASHDVIVLTDSYISIPSATWLRQMAAPFADAKIDVVIGYNNFTCRDDRGFSRRWRAFWNMTQGAQWFGTALAGHPYRGDSSNLAFRRQAFYDNKGFASTARLQDGEDDLFINEIARPDNTAVVFSPDAMTAKEIPADLYPRLWDRRKERYAFTAPMLHTGAFARQGLLSLTLWLSIFCTALAVVMAWPNLLPGCAALGLLILEFGYVMCVYRRAAKALDSRRLCLSIPLLYLWRPLSHSLYTARYRRGEAAHLASRTGLK